jgi:menaquinone-dependent protoporphyrinogen IX oxidase
MIAYVKARLLERTTWAGVVIAVTGGSALAAPYSWIAIAAGVIAVIVPNKGAE